VGQSSFGETCELEAIVAQIRPRSDTSGPAQRPLPPLETGIPRMFGRELVQANPRYRVGTILQPKISINTNAESSQSMISTWGLLMRRIDRLKRGDPNPGVYHTIWMLRHVFYGGDTKLMLGTAYSLFHFPHPRLPGFLLSFASRGGVKYAN
jgi:hypothetical protein